MENNKKFDGSLSISSVQSNLEPSFVSLRIRDDKSGIPFLHLKMSHEEFSKALTGLAERPCELKFFGLRDVGKIYEHKTEIIDFDKPIYNLTDAMIREKIAEYEVDGWQGRDMDARNHHMAVSGNGYLYKIIFGRYVEEKDA